MPSSNNSASSKRGDMLPRKELLTPHYQCLGCLKDAKLASELMICSKCKFAAYCDKECQVAHWKLHKKTCLPAAERRRVNPILGRYCLEDLQIFVNFHRNTLGEAAQSALGLYPGAKKKDSSEEYVYGVGVEEPETQWEHPSERFDYCHGLPASLEEIGGLNCGATASLLRQTQQYYSKVVAKGLSVYLVAVFLPGAIDIRPFAVNSSVMPREVIDAPADWLRFHLPNPFKGVPEHLLCRPFAHIVDQILEQSSRPSHWTETLWDEDEESSPGYELPADREPFYGYDSSDDYELSGDEDESLGTDNDSFNDDDGSWSSDDEPSGEGDEL